MAFMYIDVTMFCSIKLHTALLCVVSVPFRKISRHDIWRCCKVQSWYTFLLRSNVYFFTFCDLNSVLYTFKLARQNYGNQCTSLRTVLCRNCIEYTISWKKFLIFLRCNNIFNHYLNNLNMSEVFRKLISKYLFIIHSGLISRNIHTFNFIFTTYNCDTYLGYCIMIV